MCEFYTVNIAQYQPKKLISIYFDQSTHINKPSGMNKRVLIAKYLVAKNLIATYLIKSRYKN